MNEGISFSENKIADQKLVSEYKLSWYIQTVKTDYNTEHIDLSILWSATIFCKISR